MFGAENSEVEPGKVHEGRLQIYKQQKEDEGKHRLSAKWSWAPVTTDIYLVGARSKE